MDLPDLDLQQFGLALDLVAGWQLDVVKVSDMWKEWRRWRLQSAGSSRLAIVSKAGFWKEVELDQPSTARGPDIVGLTFEVEVYSDCYRLVTWGQQNLDPVPYPRDTIEGSVYVKVWCDTSGYHCVCKRLFFFRWKRH